VIAAACAADPWLREHPATVELTGGRFSSAEIADDHPLPSRPGRAD
jgi:acetylornithine deacetylase